MITAGVSNVDIENDGEISASYIGVYVYYSTGSQGTEITNNGSIEGGGIGVYVFGNLGLAAEITNGSKGTIESNSYAVYSSEALELSNKGKIEGLVLSYDFADEIINKGKINGDVVLSGGDDVFKNKGKATAGLIDTGTGNDLVVFADKKDSLLFDSALNAATNVDRVKKFQSGKDKFYLDDDIFTMVTPGKLSKAEFVKGTAAKDADDRIIYDKKSGALYYDPDGTGALAQTQFAQLDKGAKLKAGDFMVGEYSIVLPVV